MRCTQGRRCTAKITLSLRSQLNYTAEAGISVKGGRGVTATPILSSMVLLQFQFLLMPALSSNIPKACVLFPCWLVQTGKAGSHKTDGRTVSCIVHLCSATITNIELFCFNPTVRIRPLPGLGAGARRESSCSDLQHAPKQEQQEISAKQNPLQNSEPAFKHLGLFQGLVVWLSCSTHIHSGPSNDYLCSRAVTSTNSPQVQERKRTELMNSKGVYQ